MALIKDMILGAALTYSAIATYMLADIHKTQGTVPDATAIEETVQLAVNEEAPYIEENTHISQIGSYRHNSISYPIFEGPIGPRLGTISYNAQNLDHSERVIMAEHIASYIPDMATKAAKDLWENRGNVASDISAKINWILRGD
jgi:hypothetical protein